MEKQTGILGALLAVFVIIVLGAVFTQSIATAQTGATQLNTVNNETAALINGTAVALSHNQLNSVVSIVNATNASQTVAAANFTANLPQGQITLLNGRTGNYNVTYTYYQVSDTASQTLINLNSLFFALGVLLVVVAAVWMKLREAME